MSNKIIPFLLALCLVASTAFGATYNQPLYGTENLAQASALDANDDHPNYFTVTLNGASATWNTVAAHEIAIVTGTVRMRILAECTTDLTTGGGAATIELGTPNNTAEIIAVTTGTDLDDTEIWKDGTPDVESVASADAVRDFVVVSGTDVGVTIKVAALTAGLINFHIYWTPLSSGAMVVAGAGGAF